MNFRALGSLFASLPLMPLPLLYSSMMETATKGAHAWGWMSGLVCFGR
jgi:hypothetical protein